MPHKLVDLLDGIGNTEVQLNPYSGGIIEKAGACAGVVKYGATREDE